MSKAAVKVKKFRSLIDKIEHSTKMRTFIPSGKATANPPLGPMLGQSPLCLATQLDLLQKDGRRGRDRVEIGQTGAFRFSNYSRVVDPLTFERGINIAAFVKDFNEKTKDMKPGIPLPTRVYVNPDRSYRVVIHKPPSMYYLMQAAGIQRAAMKPGKEVAGKVTLKHIYEIALIKMEDPPNVLKTIQFMCEQIIQTAQNMGIQVVKSLDPEEYQQFLEERKVIVADQRRELDEKKEAKLLRTG